ncbi:MAG: hypothetical protein IPK91_08545 [Saprospiraceae bacterium]|jgi:hypothetical protein|nr:hypothetical protein [Saprospiraceae bacterium]MBK8297306.1 hypothetical protein [Saprospiraceae bacterium]
MIKVLQQLINKYAQELLVFGICFCILFSLGFEVMIYFPMDQSPDIQDYLKMAQFDWNQSPVRHYRILIPLVACGVQFSFGWMFELLHPLSFDGNFSLCFSFLLVNVSILSIAGVFLFKLCRNFGMNHWIAAFALIPFLSCRWTMEIAGLPLVDSLYFLSLLLVLYGFFSKQDYWFVTGIFFGPWAKEAFVFFIPMIIYMKREQLFKCMVLIGISGMLVFGFRYFWDLYLGHPFINSFTKVADSFSSIRDSIIKLFSFHGMYDLFSVCGFWILIPMFVWIKNKPKMIFKINETHIVCALYLLAVIFQMLLSGDLARMFYLIIPLYCLWIGSNVKLVVG